MGTAAFFMTKVFVSALVIAIVTEVAKAIQVSPWKRQKYKTTIVTIGIKLVKKTDKKIKNKDKS